MVVYISCQSCSHRLGSSRSRFVRSQCIDHVPGLLDYTCTLHMICWIDGISFRTWYSPNHNWNNPEDIIPIIWSWQIWFYNLGASWSERVWSHSVLIMSELCQTRLGWFCCPHTPNKFIDWAAFGGSQFSSTQGKTSGSTCSTTLDYIHNSWYLAHEEVGLLGVQFW